jgi:hypothetical protein
MQGNLRVTLLLAGTFPNNFNSHFDYLSRNYNIHFFRKTIFGGLYSIMKVNVLISTA